MKRIFALIAGLLTGAAICAAEPVDPAASAVELRWGLEIPMRDRIELNGNVYLPRSSKSLGCVLNLSPYGLQGRRHAIGLQFAANGYAFVLVDSRGRGDSAGDFRPFIQEANDGHDVVEWLAKQPWCDGKVAMWGSSYAGYTQWATAKTRPRHLKTVVPVASVYPGVDFPMRGNVSYPYVARWLTIVSGSPVQDRTFLDNDYWTARYREHFERGRAFSSLRDIAGDRGATFAEWMKHPHRDKYWDDHVPSADEYAALDVPILTITGSYDGDQPGALTYYREHMRHGSPGAKASHYLVIGPWDHDGTVIPAAAFGGLTFAPAALVDLNRLHVDWYNWTMNGGSRPGFLADKVAYYVMGAERWRYASTLDAVTAREEALYLSSHGTADDVFASGTLQPKPSQAAPFDRYIYDPRDVSGTSADSADPDSLVDQKDVYTEIGKHLVYHSQPFERSTEISGTFRFSAWIAIDQPDTDFWVSVHEITTDGRSILLATDVKRARYRESQRRAALITTAEPLRYEFDGFTFVSREAAAGSRLRLVIAPGNTISKQKNFNSGKEVAAETMMDARPVIATLFHDAQRPSTLFVPLGHPQSQPVAPSP